MNRVLDTGGAMQPTLFGDGVPSFDPDNDLPRVDLTDGAWFSYRRGWLNGDFSLFEQLRDTTTWHETERPMFDRVVDVPRLTAVLPRDGAIPAVVSSISEWLEDRYGEPFRQISTNLYRDGRDSVAPHGDQIVRDIDTSVMAILSLGGRRRFVLSPVDRRSGAAPVRLDMGEGDLLIMGGTIQRTWLHGVPKTDRPVAPRICVMFRPPWLG